MSGKYPKTRNTPVGKCPMCDCDMFEEVAEKTYGGPGHETVYYEKFVACSDCRYMEDYEPEEKGNDD